MSSLLKPDFQFFCSHRPMADSFFNPGRQSTRRDASLRQIKNRIVPKSPLPRRRLRDPPFPRSVKDIITPVRSVEDEDASEGRLPVLWRDTFQFTQELRDIHSVIGAVAGIPG